VYQCGGRGGRKFSYSFAKVSILRWVTLASVTVVRPTVTTVAEIAIEARKRDLKDGGRSSRFSSPVQLHTLPAFGHVANEDVTQTDIQAALKSIWHEKAVTTSRVLNRLSIVIQLHNMGPRWGWT